MTPPLALARSPHDPATLAFAGVIEQSSQAQRLPLIRGLSEEGFRHLIDTYFPGLETRNGTAEASCPGAVFAIDEFDDLVCLLNAHAATGSQEERWLAHAIATAAMGSHHLWQDLGLPNRGVLSQLLATHFPALAARNTGDMKWKKFVYRQLCESAGVPICKSPSCGECCDFRLCFGPEDAA